MLKYLKLKSHMVLCSLQPSFALYAFSRTFSKSEPNENFVYPTSRVHLTNNDVEKSQILFS
jgi:hypothetical protein